MSYLPFALTIGAVALAGCSSDSRPEPTTTSEVEQPPPPSLEASPIPSGGDALAETADPRPAAESADTTASVLDEEASNPAEPGPPGSVDLAEESLGGEGPPDEKLSGSETLATVVYDDDFSSNTLPTWTLRHRTVDEAPQYTLLDINRTRPGALTIEPTRTPGWFADGTAPLVFKMVSGNFSVEVDVLAESVANPGEPPGADFNSAGLMARDPASDGGRENYLMVNVGRQSGGQAPVIGTETKTTRNSSSMLDIQPGTNHGRLILCRTGSAFHSYRLMDNETEWSRIGTVQRPDLPDALQVGMVANGFSGPDLRATFFEIALRVPESPEDCTPRR